ncbi:Guanine nucleotide exchange factor lte1, partial [Ascosphaera pollenicola]
MDLDSQLLPAPRQQQQLQDPHTQYENLLPPPTASTSETPGQTSLPKHSLVAESSLPRSAINASQEFQTATTSATETPTEARLNHSVSHSHLHLQLSDQQRHGHGSRNTHMRAHILRSHQSSSDLSTHRKERLLPRSAGSSNILRWASANNFQEQDTAKSDPRVVNARQEDYAKGLRKDDGIPQWKKILTASKATRKHDRVEIDIIEALQTTQTSQKASTSTLREKGNFTNIRPQKKVGKKIIHGGIGRNGKVPFRSVKNTQADSGSRASSPSRAPFEPRLSICKDIERSLNSYFPMSVNDTNDNSIHEDKSNLISEPAKSELGRLPDQANINAHQSASDRQDRPDMAVGNTCQETEGPALVVNHPSSGSNSVHDEPSTMETTTTSFQFSQFDCDEDFDTTTGHFTHDASDVVVPFSESSEITPQLFDDLLPHMHSPFVARYAHFDGNFSAATDPQPGLVAALPSRIIAEIASDCLMDYDLVSDFFLTFRGFMNSHTLLKVLFARLEWSLDRKTADGRIARIRTFAAIRHWVLNYFVDDFLQERDGWILRNEFCSHLNRLYRKMRARMSVVNLQEPETRRGNRKARPAAVASDLKLLIDLKRCWVGRCDLFCHPTNGSGDDINGVSSGTDDVFDADRDIGPAFTPHDEKGAFCMQKDTAEANLRRLSRYTDVRFSHYSAFRPTDVTAPPPGTKPHSAASFDATSEPGDKSVDSPLDQTDAQAVVRDLDQQRQVGHVKTSSQHSVISFNSTASKGLLDIKRTFFDSVRIGAPTVRRSLSINNKPRPSSYNDVETIEIQQHKRHALTEVVRGDGQDGDVQRDCVEEPNLSVPVSHDAQGQTPVISVAMQNTLTPAPPENLIRGTLFAPVEGIVHVLGGVWNADPSRNGPGTGDRQSPQYRQRSIRGRHENPRRPLMGGWGSKKNDLSSNVGGLMSRDD